MKRLALLAAALTVVASCTLAETSDATASPPSPPSPRLHGPSAVRDPVTHGAVTVGSTWTIYYQSWTGDENFCEVLSFDTAHIFTGDKGDSGIWSGNVKLKFTGTGLFFPGMVFTGKFFNPGFAGTINHGKKSLTYGPFQLQPGNDPFLAGGC